MIKGGLGGLGLLVANWIVSKGAKLLVTDAGGEILLNKKMSKSIDDMVRVGS